MCAICQLPASHVEEFVYVSNLLRNPYFINYIDPGTGVVMTSSFTAILGLLLSFFASLVFFLRNRIFPVFRNKAVLAALVVLVLAGVGIMFGMPKGSPQSLKKVIVLGFDGMDPNILEDGWKAGRFKNLRKLRDSGYYSRLATTVPPQSPVAWASFMTGAEPAKHGIYDFIERNPRDYSLHLAFSETDSNKKNKVKVTPFWEDTSKRNIPTTVLFLPDTFEPPKSLSGEMISGMGVPDILGTQGTFTLFTTKSYPTNDYTWRGKVIAIDNGSTIRTNIEGPKYSALNETKVAKIPIEIRQSEKEVKIKVQNKTFKLKKGEFSEWIRLEFKIDFFTQVRGIAKFYLKQISPDFELYLSPINFDPDAPVKPISSPKDFSVKLSRELGQFSTLGLPHDTWALEENVFDEKAFLTQADSILAERRKIYYSKLDSFKNGLLFAYFGMPDTISHMFWRFKDKPGPYGNTISEYYQKMDEIVGRTLSKIDKNTTLFILSDHGFYSFDYEFNINSWLEQNGFLVLKKGKTGGPLFESVDWSKTRAYAAGYNSVFFNVRGREAKGIVEKKDISDLEKELVQKIKGYSNPETGDKVMREVYSRSKLGISENDPYAPDLILGFYKGTRASWDSAIGAVTDYTIRKRNSKWSGDHLFDPREVPGVLISNFKYPRLPKPGTGGQAISNFKEPRITDVMPEVLKIFGIKQ